LDPIDTKPVDTKFQDKMKQLVAGMSGKGLRIFDLICNYLMRFFINLILE